MKKNSETDLICNGNLMFFLLSEVISLQTVLTDLQIRRTKVLDILLDRFWSDNGQRREIPAFHIRLGTFNTDITFDYFVHYTCLSLEAGLSITRLFLYGHR